MFHYINLSLTVLLIITLLPHCFTQDCRYVHCDVPQCPYPESIPGQCCQVCPQTAGPPAPSQKCPRADISLPCGDHCRADTDCPAYQKCCDHGCGKSCRDTVTVSSASCPNGYSKPSTDCEKLSGIPCPAGYYCKYSLASSYAECCPSSDYNGYQPNPCENAVCTAVYCAQPYVPQGQCCSVCPPEAYPPGAPASQAAQPGPVPEPGPSGSGAYYADPNQQHPQQTDYCANVHCPAVNCYNPISPQGACCQVCPDALTTTTVDPHYPPGVNPSPSYAPPGPPAQQYPSAAPAAQQYPPASPAAQQYQPAAPAAQQYPPAAPAAQQYPPAAPAAQQYPPAAPAAQTYQPVPPPAQQFQPVAPPAQQFSPVAPPAQTYQPLPPPSPSYAPTMLESMMCMFSFCQAVNCPNSFIPPGECCEVCPPIRNCFFNGVTYNSGQVFPNDCNNCTCKDGHVYCSNYTCEKPCHQNGRRFQSGMTVKSTPCQTCTCGNGVIFCTKDVCVATPSPSPAPPRYPVRPRARNRPHSPIRPQTPAPTRPTPSDPCRGVVCKSTTCAVTYQPAGICCPICLKPGDCLYEGKMYVNGASQKENCQKCNCMDGLMVCSNDCIPRRTAPPTVKTTPVPAPAPKIPAPPKIAAISPRRKPFKRGPPPRPPPPLPKVSNMGPVVNQGPMGPPILVQTYQDINAAQEQAMLGQTNTKHNQPYTTNVRPQPRVKPLPQAYTHNSLQIKTQPYRNVQAPIKPPVRAEVYQSYPKVEAPRRTQIKLKTHPLDQQHANNPQPRKRTYPKLPKPQPIPTDTLPALEPYISRPNQPPLSPNQPPPSPNYPPTAPNNPPPPPNYPPPSPNNPPPPPNYPPPSPNNPPLPPNYPPPSPNNPPTPPNFPPPSPNNPPPPPNYPPPSSNNPPPPPNYPPPSPNNPPPPPNYPPPSPHKPPPHSQRYPALKPVPARELRGRIVSQRTGPKSRDLRCSTVSCPMLYCADFTVPRGECCPICKPKKEVVKKPGTCPPIRRSGLCVKLCNTDQDCEALKICCFNGCGTQCFIPVVKQ